MIVRYGKDFDMRRINRDLSAISGWIKESEALASEFWSSVSQEVPRCRVCSSADRKLFMRFLTATIILNAKAAGCFIWAKFPNVKLYMRQMKTMPMATAIWMSLFLKNG